MNENYFYVIHCPTQKRVFQGNWETATGFMDEIYKKIAPGPAIIETDFALQAVPNKRARRGR